MQVTKVPASPTGEVTYQVTLTQGEAMRLAYGPLGEYADSEVGWTAFSLVSALIEAIAAPSCYVPTDDVVNDLPTWEREESPVQAVARGISFTGSDYQED